MKTREEKEKGVEWGREEYGGECLDRKGAAVRRTNRIAMLVSEQFRKVMEIHIDELQFACVSAAQTREHSSPAANRFDTFQTF